MTDFLLSKVQQSVKMQAAPLVYPQKIGKLYVKRHQNNFFFFFPRWRWSHSKLSDRWTCLSLVICNQCCLAHWMWQLRCAVRDWTVPIWVEVQQCKIPSKATFLIWPLNTTTLRKSVYTFQREGVRKRWITQQSHQTSLARYFKCYGASFQSHMDCGEFEVSREERTLWLVSYL